MKRYWLIIQDRIEKEGGDWCKWIDHLAERAKDKDLIKEQYRMIEALQEEKNAAWNWKPEYEKEIARLREWIEWAVGYIEVTHGPQHRIKEAREALEGRENTESEEDAPRGFR